MTFKLHENIAKTIGYAEEHDSCLNLSRAVKPKLV